MTKWYFLRGGRVCQSKQSGVWCSLRPELHVQLFGGCFDSAELSLIHSLSALFKRIYMGQQSNPDKLALWTTLSRQRRSKCGAAGRLAKSRSSRPSWMLFHPSWWLIQNQLSRPNGSTAGCKLARFRVQINQREIVCRKAWAVAGNQAITNKPIIKVNTDVHYHPVVITAKYKARLS